MPRPKRRPSPLDDNVLGRLTFYGAVGEVTGSCYLLETPMANVLVECGLFQGGPREARRNWRPFPCDPTRLDAVLVTHAHLDHTGLLPKLRREGYVGPIYATPPTCDMLRILLPDAAHIQEQEAERQTRHRLRQGRPPQAPLYTLAEAQAALEALVPVAVETRRTLAAGLDIQYRRNGHILGAAALEIWLQADHVERHLVFSGDVGRTSEWMLLEPEPPTSAHLVLLESTYGDRDHKPHADTLRELGQILHTASTTGEHVLVPVFAVGRAQEFLYTLAYLEQHERLTLPPVYLDSPMAMEVQGLSARHASWYQPAIRRRLEAGETLAPTGLQYCPSRAASMALNGQRGAIILAGSGMCEAGRIVHHLKHHLWQPGVQVVISGFQAQGTLGRALVEGAKRVRVLGEEIAVRAQIHTLGGFSAHAGQRELLAWVAPLLASGAQVALVHGEEDKRLALAACLQAQTSHPIRRPLPGECVLLCKRGSPLVWQPAPQARRSAQPHRETPIVWHPALHRG